MASHVKKEMRCRPEHIIPQISPIILFWISQYYSLNWTYIIITITLEDKASYICALHGDACSLTWHTYKIIEKWPLVLSVPGTNHYILNYVIVQKIPGIILIPMKAYYSQYYLEIMCAPVMRCMIMSSPYVMCRRVVRLHWSYHQPEVTVR